MLDCLPDALLNLHCHCRLRHSRSADLHGVAAAAAVTVIAAVVASYFVVDER